MICYRSLWAELFSYADEGYRAFHKKLLKNESIVVIGVRTPVLRALAKKYREETDSLMTFPDEYYEVTFLKCAVACHLPYDELSSRIDALVALIDNWATCDGFAPGCITSHRREFLQKIDEYLSDDRVFVRRFALTTLLHFYVDAEFLSEVVARLRRVNCEEYYVSMAAAWLTAEVVIRDYERGIAFLKENALDPLTHNRALQKARESYRLSAEQKQQLKGLKRSVTCSCDFLHRNFKKDIDKDHEIE